MSSPSDIPRDIPSDIPGDTPNANPSRPVMQLLARGLQLWVRQQCQSIDSLEIRLEGSPLQLLRGRLAGVRLLARRVVYQQFHLELVELASGPIQVHVGNLLRGQPLQLEQAFQIQGQVSFTPAGLTRSLGDPRWRSLADSLGETLLGIVPLGGVRIHHDKLVLTALAQGRPDPIEQETTVASVGGSVEIRCVAGSPSYLLPMDPGITIGAARLEAGMLQLLGDARVSA